MKKTFNRLAFFAVTAAGLMIAGCGGGGEGSEGLNVSEAELAGLDGAALYASNCAGCHRALSNSNVKGESAGSIKEAISEGEGGMGYLRSLSNAKIVAIARALNGQSPVPTATPTPTPVPGTVDGAALYGSYCAGCHGSLANSSKKNTTVTRTQNAINGNVGGMGFLSTLTSTQVQAIVTALTTTTATPTPAPTATPTPAPVLNGATLYASNCAGCHGTLASSNKKGATVTRTQNAISGNIGGMGYLSNLTSAQIQAIVNALAVTATPAPTATPTPTAAPTPTPTPAPVNCTGCHGSPPATGRHSKHSSYSCGTCHGTGYSKTTVNSATHMNGVKNLSTSVNWNATARSCAPACHGTQSW